MEDEQFETISKDIYRQLNGVSVRNSIGILENIKLAILVSNERND